MVSALAAAVLYAPWALAANRSHGLSAALRAAAAQSGVSVVLTLLVSGVMERLFLVPRGDAARVALAVAGAVGVSAVVNVAGHLAAGTPELARTLAPALLGGASFAVLYALNLLRVRRAALSPSSSSR